MNIEALKYELTDAATCLRESCLANPASPDWSSLERILAHAAGSGEQASVAASILIRQVVEELCDRFDPALADCYVTLFSRVISRVQPSFSEGFLRSRYKQIRFSAAPLAGQVNQVVVLSRVTLGADIAVTSVFLRAAMQRFPAATIWLAGGEKNYQLFQGEPRIRHWPLAYPRGSSLAERLRVGESLQGLLQSRETLLVDPDSRISQLGLLPLAPAENTVFFESRSCHPESTLSLSHLAQEWCEQRFQITGAEPFLALAEGARAAIPAGAIALSLGVGGNPAKRLDAKFEAALVELIAATGRHLIIDAGAGGEEAERVHAALRSAAVDDTRVTVLTGSFAGFLQSVRQCALYVGYDSAGQHGAAALRIPSITVFRGFVNQRMFHRWHPRGAAEHRVIRVGEPADGYEVLARINIALPDLLRRS